MKVWEFNIGRWEMNQTLSQGEGCLTILHLKAMSVFTSILRQPSCAQTQMLKLGGLPLLSIIHQFCLPCLKDVLRRNCHSRLCPFTLIRGILLIYINKLNM